MLALAPIETSLRRQAHGCDVPDNTLVTFAFCLALHTVNVSLDLNEEMVRSAPLDVLWLRRASQWVGSPRDDLLGDSLVSLGITKFFLGLELCPPMCLLGRFHHMFG